MSVTANITYTASFPKRPDITGAPNQVFKFNNFLDHLIGGIKANTISAIGTINPGSLCTQYLYAPQIHFNLAGEPIAFIGNLSNEMGEFSLIKIDVTSIRLFPYIKDKATMDVSLNHGDNLPKESLSKTNWNDFKDKEPIIGTLIPNFFITYFGQDLPHGDISDNKIKAKLICLGTGYDYWEHPWEHDALAQQARVHVRTKRQGCGHGRIHHVPGLIDRGSRSDSDQHEQVS
jgi:hypothetical protein